MFTQKKQIWQIFWCLSISAQKRFKDQHKTAAASVVRGDEEEQAYCVP